MSNTIEANRRIRELGEKSETILQNKSLTNAEKKSALDGLTAELKQHRQTLEMHTKTARLMAYGEAGNSGGFINDFASIAPRKGGVVPSLSIPEDALTEGYMSIKGGGGARFELGVTAKDAANSTTTAGQLPAELIGLVDKRFEPSRILDHLNTTAMSGPSIEFITHTANSAAAAAVAAGGAFPETSLTTTQTILSAQKIAVLTTVTDELLADFPTFRAYLQVELQRQIIDAENNAIINGTGTAPQIRGLLNTSGTLTRVKAAAPETQIDTLNLAINDLRSGSSFVEPDLFICHPTTWTTIRGLKDGMNRYILGDPGQSAVNGLWGVPVVTSTQIATGTGVLMNAEVAATAFIRQGVTLEMSNGQDFGTGQVKIRATERLALGVQRPSAVNIVTGL